MKNRRIAIAGIAIAAIAAAGGITAAASAGTSSAPAATPSPVPMTSPSPGNGTTVHTVQASVNGKTETILADGHGLPLYYYRPDTATRSLVTGGVLRLWPALLSAMPTATGVSAGQITSVSDSHGQQVAYNGHLLYTFVSDRSGRVTGQGVQNFFIATPGLAPEAGQAASSAPASPPGGGYSY
jgi:predicted lipoprotein with Yx(FWY)xxD motif